MSGPAVDKATLRALVRERLGTLGGEARRAGAQAVCAAVAARPELGRAGRVLLFAPLPDELDVFPLLAGALAGGKRLFLPAREPATGGYGVREVRSLADDLVPGCYGVREPAAHCPGGDLRGLDFAVVPGIGFDPAGGRLGRGKGFYDRMLARFSGVACGVAFAEQMLPSVPWEPHDMRLDLVVTPGRTWVGRGRPS
ncbi:MAG: 5-formyltetrahydrofolate cyclo-ligase [Verrucomicrobiota bacterium]